MTEASLDHDLTAARREHLVPGREIHMREMRGRPFCEVSLITAASEENDIANIWNTAGACDPTPEQVDELDADIIARENRALRAWLSPVRHWMFDRLDARQAGDDKAFGSITGTWIGAVDAGTLQATDDGGYDPGYTYGDHTVTYSAGSEAYLLDAPDGEVFVMQSSRQQWEATLSGGDLDQLYQRLDLPAGWGFHAELLDQDLEVTSSPDNLAHVLRDNLQNVYLGSDAGRAFSPLTPRDSLW
jgi:hypothetical protein